jgi:hypothetical protein
VQSRPDCCNCRLCPGTPEVTPVPAAAHDTSSPALLLASCSCKPLGKLLPSLSCRHRAATCCDDSPGRNSSSPYE